MKPDRIAILLLLQRAYFTRTWILSEIMQMKSNHKLLCSEHSLDFHLLPKYEYYSNLRQHNKVHFQMADDSVFKAMMGFTQSLESDEGYEFAYLLHLMQVFENTSCSDPRDRIFAMLGTHAARIFDPGMQLKPDYTMDTHELYIAFVAYWDMLCVQKKEKFVMVVATEMVKALSKCLGLKPVAVQKWLKKQVRRNDDSNDPPYVRTCSGRQISCSGPILTDMLNSGDLGVLPYKHL